MKQNELPVEFEVTVTPEHLNKAIKAVLNQEKIDTQCPIYQAVKEVFPQRTVSVFYRIMFLNDEYYSISDNAKPFISITSEECLRKGGKELLPFLPLKVKFTLMPSC